MIKKNIFSIIVALAILYLSLANSKSFNEVPFLNIPYFDKVAHFLMYFGLMLVIAFEHRNEITGRTQLSMFALIPFVYGILMEILQLTITADRSGNIYDVLANSAGIIFAALLWLLLGPRLKTIFK
jgi:VanZ family protein